MKTLLQQISSPGLRVYFVLRLLAGREGVVTVTLEELSEHTGVHVPHCSVARLELIKLGLVEQMGKSTYKLLTPPRVWINRQNSPRNSSTGGLGDFRSRRASASRLGFLSPSSSYGSKTAIPQPPKRSIASSSDSSEAALARQACSAVGIPIVTATQRLIETVAVVIRKRLSEGVSADDLQRVTRWARAELDGGSRYTQLRNPAHLFGPQFTIFLASAKALKPGEQSMSDARRQDQDAKIKAAMTLRPLPPAI